MLSSLYLIFKASLSDKTLASRISSLFSADGKSTDIFDDSEGGGSVINPEDDEEYYEYGVIKEGDMMDDMGGYDENKKYSTDDEYEGKY